MVDRVKKKSCSTLMSILFLMQPRHKNNQNIIITRLISIESQPKKIVVVVLVVVVFVVVFVVVIIVGHKNLTLKFGQSWVIINDMF